jgi:hypothetical protein
MKNESDETATKKRNEDFLKELDKDRTEKACEYAVLVSLIEPESELYNSGIVDVSHRYPKMYVVRPQFFVPLITLLRNAALNAMKYKSELALVRSQNVDITKFDPANRQRRIGAGGARGVPATGHARRRAREPGHHCGQGAAGGVLPAHGPADSWAYYAAAAPGVDRHAAGQPRAQDGLPTRQDGAILW